MSKLEKLFHDSYLSDQKYIHSCCITVESNFILPVNTSCAGDFHIVNFSNYKTNLLNNTSLWQVSYFVWSIQCITKQLGLIKHRYDCILLTKVEQMNIIIDYSAFYLSKQWWGLFIRNIRQSSPHQPPVPCVHWRSHTVTSFTRQLLVSLYPVHHVEVAHLILCCRTNPGDTVAIWHHGASGSHSVTSG